MKTQRVSTGLNDQAAHLQRALTELRRSLAFERKKRVEAERELSLANQKFVDLTQQVFAYVSICTADGIIMEANRALLELGGSTPEDVIGEPFEQAYWWSFSKMSQDHVRRALQQAAEGRDVRVELLARTESGEIVELDALFAPLFDENHDTYQTLFFAVDITSKQRAAKVQDELISIVARQHDDIERCSRTAAHDLRGPLVTIRGLTSILERELPAADPNQLLDLCRKIQKAAKSIDRLITDPDFAQNQCTKMGIFGTVDDLRQRVQRSQLVLTTGSAGDRN